MSKTLEMFYDFSSPYAYIGHRRAASVAKAAGAAFRPRPFLLGGLFKSLGSAMVPIQEATPQKRRVLEQDIFRQAEIADLQLQWPSRFPMNTILALRVALQFEGQEHLDVMSAIFGAYWADDRDINDPAVLHDVLLRLGLDADACLVGCQRPEIKDALRLNTEEALMRGAIGAPAFFVGGDHAWGQDRLNDVVPRLLQGWRPKHG